jgi:hypothetical protein
MPQSPQHTVILHDGVSDIYAAIMERLKAAQVAADDLDYGAFEGAGDAALLQCLLERRRIAQELTESFFMAWTQLTVVNRRPKHDGALHVFTDPGRELSFGFRYDKSCYAGGLIFWPKDEEPKRGDKPTGPIIPGGRWQTHT